MKKILSPIILIVFLIPLILYSQKPKVDKVDQVLQKGDNSINKVKNILAVFQPYLLKARQLYYEGKQLASDVKNSKNTIKQMNNSGNQNNGYNNSYTNNTNVDTSSNQQNPYANNGYTNNTNNSNYNNSNNNGNNNNNGYSNNNNLSNNTSTDNSAIQNYLPTQNLPVNNPSTVNNDGTGNLGNQNNGLYGNCLDVMTGTVMGLGEAEDAPKSVDIIFVAANGTYQLWTPNYARNEVAAQYTSRSTYESVSKWSDVNETEIASTRITLGQFDQIQNNSQILNAVKNAQDYSSSITEFGKMDGKVYAVKAELEDRTVYGLIAVVKHYGTDGSNGYLKIKIKAQGVGNGQVNANMYQR